MNFPFSMCYYSCFISLRGRYVSVRIKGKTTGKERHVRALMILLHRNIHAVTLAPCLDTRRAISLSYHQYHSSGKEQELETYCIAAPHHPPRPIVKALSRSLDYGTLRFTLLSTNAKYSNASIGRINRHYTEEYCVPCGSCWISRGCRLRMSSPSRTKHGSTKTRDIEPA